MNESLKPFIEGDKDHHLHLNSKVCCPLLNSKAMKKIAGSFWKTFSFFRECSF